MSYGEREIIQEQQEQSPVDTYISNLSNSVGKRQRATYQDDEAHHSKQTAEEYRMNFRHFLDYIGVHDLDIFQVTVRFIENLYYREIQLGI